MSCYNASTYVVEAIESILCQTFTNFEFIIIDDGSADNTLNIIKRYAAKDNRIVVIAKENTGLTDSLNLGILKSRGEFIARLDADDVSLPERLQEQVAFFDRFPNIVLLGTDIIEVDHKGGIVKVNSYPSRHHDLFNNLCRRKKFFTHSSVMFRLAAFKQIGKYNPRLLLAEDCDLWLRFAEQGKIACLNIPLVKIRKHDVNISNSKGGKTQLLYALTATVSHYLRANGIPDPSISENDSDWNSFLEWITPKIEHDPYFQSRSKWVYLRQDYYSQSNKVSRLWRLFWNLCSSGCAYRLLYEKFLGTDLPERLANEWRGKVISERSPSYPIISVVMSCYNAADYVSEAIESVLSQTFTNFEFIIVDDGSVDATLDILKYYAMRDNRIVIIEKNNTGLTNSLNFGISKARGELIVMVGQNWTSF